MGISLAQYNEMLAKTTRARQKGGSLPATDEGDDEFPEWTKNEVALQAYIKQDCEARGEICITSNPRKPTTCDEGVWDCTIYAENGRTILIEVKKRKRKRSPKQLEMHAKALKLKHESYLIRTPEGYHRARNEKKSEEPQAGGASPSGGVGSVRDPAAGLVGAGARDRTKTD